MLKHIQLFFLKVFGFTCQDRRALARADSCLSFCQTAFFTKAFAETGSEVWQKAWEQEKFWSRNHGRFWKLAYRRPPFKKD